MLLGKISEVDNNSGLKLIVDGESSATTKQYHYLASYVPTAGDRVLIEEIGESYVVIGKVVDKYTDCGKARTANSASSASSATNATNATYASRINQYSAANSYVEFTYFNSNLWVRINGSTQFALAKG